MQARAGTATAPIGLWQFPTSADGGRRYRPVGVALIVLAALCALMVVVAIWADDRGWAQVMRSATPTPATVLAVHANNDFINPSIVDVELATSPPRGLAVRTTDEDAYHVGQGVTVLLDTRHPSQSGFRGDSTGPTWTLGAVGVSALVGGVAGIVGLALTVIHLLALHRRRQIYAHEIAGPRVSEIAAFIAATPPAAYPTGPPAGLPAIIASHERRRRLLLLTPLLLLSCVVTAGLVSLLTVGLGPAGLDRLLLEMGGVYLALYVAALGHSLYSSRSANLLTWTPATASLCASRRRGPVANEAFLIITDREHAGVYHTRIELPDVNAVRLIEGPCWVAGSRVPGQLFVFSLTGAGVVNAHLWTGWQVDERLRFVRGDSAYQDHAGPRALT